jgi:hypothetical protein
VIALADTVTALDARHAGAVLVTGSHGGTIAAWYAARAQVRAAIFNDAGGGLDDAGVGGLAELERIGMAAAAVAHTSARIADARDTLACGLISRVNGLAARCRVRIGQPAADAARLLESAALTTQTLQRAQESRLALAPGVTGVDSIGLVAANDAGAILVIGSHGALHGGDPATALPVAARAAFFHDAGGGKDGAGFTRLPVLDARGIAAATVDYRSARIGDARSMWECGVISRVNAAMAALGAGDGTTVRAAAARMRA